MGFFSDNQKTGVRFKNSDFTFYEPTIEQIETIEEIIKEQINVDDSLNASGEISSKVIRYIIKELTSIGDEIDEFTDEELVEHINNGNEKVVILMREVERFINMMVEEIQHKQYRIIDMASKMINIMTLNDDTDAIKGKMEKLFKKKGIDLSLEEFNKVLEGEKIELKETSSKKKTKKTTKKTKE